MSAEIREADFNCLRFQTQKIQKCDWRAVWFVCVSLFTQADAGFGGVPKNLGFRASIVLLLAEFVITGAKLPSAW